ncbi:hypothetical protein KSP40_PGU017382 [Platanthera guangdongensis]|uniref:Uncharacterized protein n=1 Tax=Platanthera guangdongensis TaxID=2320717 RepID=A0ABR2MIU3_9ASPA
MREVEDFSEKGVGLLERGASVRRNRNEGSAVDVEEIGAAEENYTSILVTAIRRTKASAGRLDEGWGDVNKHVELSREEKAWSSQQLRQSQGVDIELSAASYQIKMRRAQEPQGQPNFPEIPTHSWYPPSVVNTCHPSTPGSASITSGQQRPSDRPLSPSRGQPSPAEAAVVIARLKDKRLPCIFDERYQFTLHIRFLKITPFTYSYFHLTE